MRRGVPMQWDGARRMDAAEGLYLNTPDGVNLAPDKSVMDASQGVRGEGAETPLVWTAS